MISPDTTSIISVGCYLWGLLTAFHWTSRQLVTSRSRLGLGRKGLVHIPAITPIPRCALPLHRILPHLLTAQFPLARFSARSTPPTDTEIGQERSVSPGTLSPISRGTLGESAASINPCLACSQPWPPTEIFFETVGYASLRRPWPHRWSEGELLWQRLPCRS